MILSKKNQAHLDKISEATFCIIIGTILGLLTYWLFLFLNISIFGWNLGLVVSPLVAGYSETHFAIKYMGETTGADSAFILFAVTVIYGFILTNPTLGVNVITIGAVFIILQSAIPTVINYFIIILSLSIISYMSGIFKKFTDFLYKNGIMKILFKKDEYVNKNIENATNFDKALTVDINDLDILILSTTHIEEYEIIEYTGVYEGRVIYKAKNPMGFEKNTDRLLKDLINVKNQAILKLTESVKKDDCDGILDLTLRYEILDGRGTMCIATAHGTGIKYK